MVENPTFNGIPEEFQSLYTGSAREVMGRATEMVRGSVFDYQEELLSYPCFVNPVISALQNLDERRTDYSVLIIAAFDKDLQPEASELFRGGFN